MGTYNYQGVESGLSIVRTFTQHLMLDMAPYYRYGNVSPADLNQESQFMMRLPNSIIMK